ncbi:MAG: hypothetical protein ACRC33_23545 [Gemmataceae bacterium]
MRDIDLRKVSRRDAVHFRPHFPRLRSLPFLIPFQAGRRPAGLLQSVHVPVSRNVARGVRTGVIPKDEPPEDRRKTQAMLAAQYREVVEGGFHRSRESMFAAKDEVPVGRDKSTAKLIAEMLGPTGCTADAMRHAYG